ncbi:ATPase family protein associated with various cellular activities (AAA) [Tenacibaculum gallaicum]|uniref:ATPase family protein associated with various cellular activities (AAA) n=1 Tax=Tenacibaculum gallaicum TaxID=561505 RepID=A0A3E0HDW5_9FLAO|nr:ATP-binding protein [Tenacibaculum gallaicum]REH43422.1 ATPase family protein associated with various cellular activities (AAA) [Tenacibaculum gallaicum]
MAIHNLILQSKETTVELDEVHLSSKNKNTLSQLLKEFKHVTVLDKFKLPLDNKVLLFGHTGCGKTTTAKAIAKKLNKKIIILNLGNIISSKLGETAKNISEVFKKATRESAVLFLDEFDYIGKARDYDSKDSSEMKRLVNTVIQLIDQLPNNVLLIAATNHSSVIDTALLRRFQLKLKFEAPSETDLDSYYETLLQQFPEEFREVNRVYGISYAEAKDITFRAVKNKIIEKEELNNQLVNE